MFVVFLFVLKTQDWTRDNLSRYSSVVHMFLSSLGHQGILFVEIQCTYVSCSNTNANGTFSIAGNKLTFHIH